MPRYNKKGSTLYVMHLKESDVAYVGDLEELNSVLRSNIESENIKDYDFYELGTKVQMKPITGIELAK